MSGSRPDSEVFVLAYDWPAERGARVRELYPAHRAHVDDLGRRGDIWMIGALPVENGREGALAIFRSLPSATLFVTEDPLFVQGVAESRGIRAWSPLIFPAS